MKLILQSDQVGFVPPHHPMNVKLFNIQNQWKQK